MASKKIKVQVGLDFTSEQMSIDKIRKQIDEAVSAVKINLDPQSAKKFEAELRELGGMLEKHLNKNTGKINAKNLVADLNNNENFLMIEKLGQRYAEVGVNGQQSFRKVADEADFLNKKISSSNQTLEKMGTTLMNTIRWNISSSAVNAVTGEFQKIYYFAKDLDRTLTDIRIVTGQSADQMDRFAISANESAKALRVSTIEYAQAATLFFQQGLGEFDVRKMTDGAVMASRITGVAAADMADLLTSTMNGYRLSADEVTKVTDKLAAVGAETAADFHEISVGMSKVASMANTAGVSIDQLNAQIATIVSVTRESPESIGTSLKTIYGRMLMFKTDTKALMKDDDGEVFGAPKVEEALQAYNRVAGAQISLFKTTEDGRRELRDLGEVIEEIGNSWETVTDRTAKFGLATALAGSRQQNRLVALFDSWDMYKDAVETSLNAEGTTLKQNAIYMESYEGRLKGLQAAKEELYMVLTDTGSLKDFISMLTKGVELVSSLAEATGGFSAVVGILGASMSKTFATKFHEVGGLSGLIAGKGTDATTDAEIDNKNKLLTINKMLGAEEANRLRNNLKGAQDSQKAHQTMFELMSKEAELIQEIARIEESKLATASKKDTYDNMDEENKRLMEESTNLIALKAAYADLTAAKLEGESLMQSAAAETGEAELAALDKSFDEVTTRIDDAQARIDNIKAQVPNIEEKAQEHGRTAGFEKKRVGVASDELNKQFEESQKILQTQRAIQTTMMLLPSIISTATDDTKSLGDVAQAGLKMLVPMIPTIVGGVMELPAAFAKAQAGASAFSVVMSTSLGPILAIAAGVIGIGLALKAVNDSTVTFAKSMKELEKASEELAEQESAYEAIEQQLEQIKTRREEIAAIGKDDDTTDEEKEKLEQELTLLDAKHGRLKQELVIEEMLLQAAREKAEIAAKQAVTTTMSSDYSSTSDGFGVQVTVAEELELATAAYVDAEDQMLNYKKALADLETAEKSTARQIKRAQKDLDNATEARDKAAEHVSEYSGAIREIIVGLENEEGTNEDLIKSLEEYLDVSTDTIAKTLGIGEAFEEAAPEEFIGSVYEVIDQMEELAEAYGDATGAIETYGAFLEDLNSEEGLSIANRDKIIQKHQELIPYLDDVAAMRDFLIQKIKEEEEAQREAYTNMIMISEDFFNAKIKGNDTLYKTLGEFYTEDLKNATSLADAKRIVEESLVKDLSGTWAKYYNVASSNQLAEADYRKKLALGFGTAEEQAAMRAAVNAIDQQREVARRFEELAEEFASGVDFSSVDLSSIKSGSTKDDYKASADRYAKINQELDKNNALLQKNKILQDLAGDDLVKKLELMEEEKELNKQRQKSLNDLNNERRKEMVELEKTLSGQGFDFQGEGDNRIITNLDKIKGKTEEVEKDFKRYIELQSKLLPQAGQEWWKLEQNIENVKDSIEELNKQIYEERRDKLYEMYSDGIKNLEHQISLEKELIELTNSEDDKTDMQLKINSLTESQIHMLKELNLQREYELNLMREIGDTESDRYKSLLDNYRATELKILQLQRQQKQEYESIANDIISAIKDGYREMLELEKASVNQKVKLAEEEYNKKIKLLDDWLSHHNGIIDEMLKDMDRLNETEDYDEQINELTKQKIEAEEALGRALNLSDSAVDKDVRIADARKELEKINSSIDKTMRDRARTLRKQELQDTKDQNSKIVDDKKNSEQAKIDSVKSSAEREIQIIEQKYDALINNDRMYESIREEIMKGTYTNANEHISKILKSLQRETATSVGAMGKSWQELENTIYRVVKAQKALQNLGQYPSVTDGASGGSSNTDLDRQIIGSLQRQYMSFIDDNARNTILKEQEEDGYLWKLNQEAEKIRKKHGWNYEDYTHLPAPGFRDGGVVDFTGVANVHGSKTSAEVVFNAGQAKKLHEYINNLPKMPHLMLNSIIPKLTLPQFKSSGGTVSEPNGDNIYNISLNIDKVTGDVDGGKQVFSQLIKEIKLNGGVI